MEQQLSALEMENVLQEFASVILVWEHPIATKKLVSLFLHKREKERETERQRDRETERKRDRETERQRDRETE